mgnify:CR=1 FL=1
MTAQDDVGFSACIRCGAGACAARGQPGFNGGPREEQFPSSFGTGNLLVGDEVVDLSLLDPKQLRHFAGGQKVTSRRFHGQRGCKVLRHYAVCPADVAFDVPMAI